MFNDISIISDKLVNFWEIKKAPLWSQSYSEPNDSRIKNLVSRG